MATSLGIVSGLLVWGALSALGLLLASIHLVEGSAWLFLCVAMLARVGAALRRPAVRRTLDGACGAALPGFGARLALERRQQDQQGVS